MLRISIIICGLLLFSQAAFSQDKEEVYAGIILHIMKYVEWPEYNDANMIIGVVNNNDLTNALNDATQGKQVHFKDVAVTKYTDLSKLDCHVLFVPKKMSGDIDDVETCTGSEHILVITEEKSSSTKGAAINFYEESGNLKFEIYQGQMAECGLKVSEQLTKYAVVKD